MVPGVLLERAELCDQCDDAAGARAARERALRIYRESGAEPNAERLARELEG